MAAPDDFPGFAPDGPAVDFAAVTPSDSVDLAFRTRGIYVGGAGAVSVLAKDGSTAVVFAAVPVGTTLYIRTSRIRATGTTATNLVALR